jgi:hypothetical protein
MTTVFPHQKEVFHELKATAAAFFSDAWQELQVKPRFTRLLAGPSGSGKTFLAKNLAESLGLPFWECAATTWIPLGCSQRGARPTWLDIAAFIRANERCVIFADEVDKLGCDTSVWMTSIRVEIFGLLDRALPRTLRLECDMEDGDYDLPEDLKLIQNRLAKSAFLIGGGAFQDLWDKTTGATIGFSSGEHTVPNVDHKTIASVIPVEIANRFVAPLLRLSPLNRSDYLSMFAHAETVMPVKLRATARRIAHTTLDAAVRQSLGCRWIEQIMLRTVMEEAAPSVLSGVEPEGST